MATDKDLFVTDLRREATVFWDSYQRLLSLSDEFTARGWSGQVTQGDLADQNYDITPQLLSDFIGTVAAVDTLMDSGHKTNTSKMLKRT
jgi:hypothetical protein